MWSLSVIFNPDYKGTVKHENALMGSDYTTYDGFEQKGIAEKVFLRGNLMAENGKFVGEKGIGKQAMSKPFALAYDKFKEK